MMRVKSWAEYRDNWLDFAEFTITVTVECVIALVLVVFMVPVAFVACIVGYHPEDEKNGKR